MPKTRSDAGAGVAGRTHNEPRLASSEDMASISGIALSGMQAAMAGLQASAHNIANASTDGFRRQELALEATAGGVAYKFVPAPVSGSALERDLVAQLAAKYAFLANLAVFRAAYDVAGTLLNLRS